MANLKTSDESPAGPLSGAELVRLVQGGVNVRGTTQDIADLASGAGGTVSPLTTKGDLYAYSTDNDRLAVGGNGQVLTADSSASTGLSWQTPSSGGGGAQTVEAVRVYNGSTQSVAHNTETVLTFDSESYDTDALHDTSSNTGRLTCVTAGKYVIQGAAEFPANATGLRQLRVRLNGTTIIGEESQVAASGTNVSRLGVHTVYDLAEDDYVELLAYQNSGSGLNIAAGEGTTFFAMTLQGGTAATSTLQSITFTASGTLNIPAGVTSGWLTMIGSGGGGSTCASAAGGGGGGAGEVMVQQPIAVASGAAYTVTIGAAGAGAASGSGSLAGSDGGSVSVAAIQTWTVTGGKGATSSGQGGNGGGGGGRAGGTGAGTVGSAESNAHFGGSSGGGGGTGTSNNGAAGGPSGGYSGAAGGTAAASQSGGGGGASTIYGQGGAGGGGGSAGSNAASTSYGAGGGGAGGKTGNTNAGGNGAPGYVLFQYVA